MALETLKDVRTIGGCYVTHNYDADPDEFPIIVFNDTNMICFRFQDGPIKEVGINGCQVDTLIHAAKVILEGLNEKYPCEENRVAVIHLNLAIETLLMRTKDREKRGVEGTSKA